MRGMGPAAHDDDADPMDAALSEQLRRSRDFTVEEAASAAAAAATTTTTLGDLPPEIVAYVLKMAAPAVPIYAPVEQPPPPPPPPLPHVVEEGGWGEAVAGGPPGAVFG